MPDELEVDQLGADREDASPGSPASRSFTPAGGGAHSQGHGLGLFGQRGTRARYVQAEQLEDDAQGELIYLHVVERPRRRRLPTTKQLEAAGKWAQVATSALLHFAKLLGAATLVLLGAVALVVLPVWAALHPELFAQLSWSTVGGCAGVGAVAGVGAIVRRKALTHTKHLG